MADLFLHLAFARRLRTSDGLHPIVGEALARRAGLVAFGAAVAQLPQHERMSLGFFRRLFGGGSDAARWQKQLSAAPGQVRADLIAAVLTPSVDKGERGAESRRETAEGAPGSMQRLALALGLLAHDLLEIAVGPLTSNANPAERAAIERAQARLWLQAAVPNAQDLEREWRPIAELGETDTYKAAVAHLDRALHRAFKVAPGEAGITRWMKRLAADVAPVLDVAKTAGLPPSLSLADASARAPHFEENAYLEKVQGALSRFVIVANRLAVQLLDDAPPERVLANLNVALGVNADVATATAEVSEARTQWRDWMQKNRTAALERGRNPKPAFEESSSGEERPPSLLPELPPESSASGAPPLPDMSGPVVPPPTMTQEVSLAQIEAEAAAQSAGFAAPAHTQEISAVQIESAQADSPGFDPPPHTQEVSLAQIEELRPSASTTQPISAEDILLARGDGSSGGTPAAPAPENGAAPAAAATGPSEAADVKPDGDAAAKPDGAAPVSAPEAADGQPTPAHTEGAASPPATAEPQRES